MRTEIVYRDNKKSEEKSNITADFNLKFQIQQRRQLNLMTALMI